MPYRDPAGADEADPRSGGPTIRITPKGINALAQMERRRFSALPWWSRLWGLRAHRRLMAQLGRGRSALG